MEIILVVWALIASVAAGLFYKKSLGQPAPASLPSSSPGKTTALPSTSVSDEALKATEKKLADVRAELAAQKDKLTSKQKELDELREQQKAKARREGKKEATVAEEKKGPLPAGPAAVLPDAPEEEVALVAAVAEAIPRVAELSGAEDFAGAMRALADLRGPVDAFFEKVLVNAEDPLARDNRLRLLAQVRAAMSEVADFGQVNG